MAGAGAEPRGESLMACQQAHCGVKQHGWRDRFGQMSGDGTATAPLLRRRVFAVVQHHQGRWRRQGHGGQLLFHLAAIFLQHVIID